MTTTTRCRPIQVAVVHRNPHVAAGIASLLRSRADFVVRAGMPADGHADVVVSDYATAMHEAMGADVALSAVTAVTAARAASAACLVVTDQNSGWQLRRALDAGVRGYLLQDCSGGELADAVCCLAQGRRYLSCSAADRLLDSLLAATPTARELQVLRLAAQGLVNKEIGLRLCIGESTVKTHVKAVLRKLGEPTRAAAAAQALRRGLFAAALP